MKTAVLVSLVVTLAAAASAPAAPSPPVIHEPFTLLPCPMHPETTVAPRGLLGACDRRDRPADQRTGEEDLRTVESARSADDVRRERAFVAPLPQRVVRRGGVVLRRRNCAAGRVCGVSAAAEPQPSGGSRGAGENTVAALIADQHEVVSRGLVARIHNQGNRICACDPDCWCRRTALGRVVKWWFPARLFGLRNKGPWQSAEWKRAHDASS